MTPSESAALAVALGARIHRARKAAGLTQRQVATAAGVGHAAVSAMERGARLPSFQVFWSLARAMNVPAAVLLPDQPEGATHEL